MTLLMSSKNLRFYHYPNCSTCQKAKQFLLKHQIDFELLDIVKTPPTVSELEAMLKSQEEVLNKLFNTSGQVYRELDIKSKLKTLKLNEALELLANNGKLIKRPFLIGEKVNLIGFNEELWKMKLL